MKCSRPPERCELVEDSWQRFPKLVIGTQWFQQRGGKEVHAGGGVNSSRPGSLPSSMRVLRKKNSKHCVFLKSVSRNPHPKRGEQLTLRVGSVAAAGATCVSATLVEGGERKNISCLIEVVGAQGGRNVIT